MLGFKGMRIRGIDIEHVIRSVHRCTPPALAFPWTLPEGDVPTMTDGAPSMGTENLLPGRPSGEHITGAIRLILGALSRRLDDGLCGFDRPVEAPGALQQHVALIGADGRDLREVTMEQLIRFFEGVTSWRTRGAQDVSTFTACLDHRDRLPLRARSASQLQVPL